MIEAAVASRLQALQNGNSTDCMLDSWNVRRRSRLKGTSRIDDSRVEDRPVICFRSRLLFLLTFVPFDLFSEFDGGDGRGWKVEIGMKDRRRGKRKKESENEAANKTCRRGPGSVGR